MGISIWHLLMVLLIVALLFGTRKLRTIGGDLGIALKSFQIGLKDAVEGENEPSQKQPERLASRADDRVYEVQEQDKDSRV